MKVQEEPSTKNLTRGRNYIPAKEDSFRDSSQAPILKPKEFLPICNEQEQKLQLSSQKIKITKNSISLMAKLKYQSPLSFSHVFNFFNIWAINTKAIQNQSCSQSYYYSLFYIKSVEKVQMRKNAVSSTSTMQRDQVQIEELICKYRSFGDEKSYTFANQLDYSLQKLKEVDFQKMLRRCSDEEPLSRFIERMKDKAFIFKMSSNKLVVSKALLDLLGQDIQNYALQLCKFKVPLQEMFSNNQYSLVMGKMIENVSFLCDYLTGKIDFTRLQEETELQYFEQLYTKNKKCIPCKMKLNMVSPSITCFQVLEIYQEHVIDFRRQNDQEERWRLFAGEMKELRFREAGSLMNLTCIKSNMLKENQRKVAGYITSNSFASLMN